MYGHTSNVLPSFIRGADNVCIAYLVKMQSGYTSLSLRGGFQIPCEIRILIMMGKMYVPISKPLRRKPPRKKHAPGMWDVRDMNARVRFLFLLSLPIFDFDLQ